MANITAALVKELRDRTGAGMMDCKKALVAADGDIEVAIDNMRKNGQAKAAKKAGRVTAEGVIAYASNENKAYIVEINCETDFVAKDAGFNEFCNNVARVALDKNVADVEALKNETLFRPFLPTLLPRLAKTCQFAAWPLLRVLILVSTSTATSLSV